MFILGFILFYTLGFDTSVKVDLSSIEYSVEDEEIGYNIIAIFDTINNTSINTDTLQLVSIITLSTFIIIAHYYIDRAISEAKNHHIKARLEQSVKEIPFVKDIEDRITALESKPEIPKKYNNLLDKIVDIVRIILSK